MASAADMCLAMTSGIGALPACSQSAFMPASRLLTCRALYACSPSGLVAFPQAHLPRSGQQLQLYRADITRVGV